ncbi:hypothetical protein SAMN06297422_13120 [Lachnospiraceae bacterium]|nr:hypothetical protein SAMN06297422_13120 [Lachnospiraceae bacterium]
MYKKQIAAILLLLMIFNLAACGSKTSESKLESKNNVQSAIDEQIAKETSEDGEAKAPAAKVESETTEADTEKKAELTTEKSTEASTEAKIEMASSSDADIDLTVMSSDMVYSTVYQLLADADSYVGKKVKISGPFYSAFFEDTNQQYFFVIIRDATACCQQGMEFIWDDGSHVYPDEYPPENAEVEVVGTFETYKDNPDDEFQYCRLKDASLVVLDSTSNNE